MRLLTLVLLFCAACAGPRLPDSHFLAERPAPPGAAEDAATVLLHEERWLVVPWVAGRQYTEVEVHRVVAIHSEAGMAAATGTFFFDGQGEVVEARGRTITPEGVEIPVTDFGRDVPHGNGQKERRFQFPGATVGATLEGILRIRVPQMMTRTSQRMRDQVPVLLRRIEILAPRSVELEARRWPGGAEFRIDEIDGLQRFSWEERDLPAFRDERASGHWMQQEPFWRMRVRNVRVRGVDFPVYTDPGAALAGRASLAWIDERVRSGFEAPDLRGPCAGEVHCIVDRAVAWVRERVRVDDSRGSPDQIWSHVDVLREGRGSRHEVALLLFRILVENEVNAAPAAVARRFAVRWDEDFPTDEGLVDTLVAVVTDPAAARILWLDPGCAVCEPGEVSPHVAGGTAVIYRASPPPIRSQKPPQVVTAVLEVTPEAAPLQGQVERYRLVVGEDGSIAGTTFDSRYGPWIGDPAAPRPSRAEVQKRLDAWAAKLGPTVTAAVEAIHPCEAGACSRTGTLSLAGPSASPRIHLPLRFFSGHWADLLEERGRQTDLLWEARTRLEDEVEIVAPAGWELLVPALPEDARAGAFSVDYEVERGEGRVVIRRVLEVAAGRHPVAGFPAMQALLRDAIGLRDLAVELRRPGT